MTKTYYHKELGPQVYPANATAPSGANWFATESAYLAWQAEQQKAAEQAYYDSLDPNTLRQQIKDELKELRKQYEYGGFEFMGMTWASETKDELRFNSVDKLFEKGLLEYEGYKVNDTIYITLTPAILNGASMALAQHYGRCFEIERAKKEQLDALATVKDLLNWQNTQMNIGWGE